MQLKRKQKIVLAVYVFTLVYLFTYLPWIISLPCGDIVTTKAWVWEEKPLFIELNITSGNNEVPAPTNWSIDWRRLIPRLLVASFIVLLTFIFMGDRKNGAAD